jgi:ferritin
LRAKEIARSNQTFFPPEAVLEESALLPLPWSGLFFSLIGMSFPSDIQQALNEQINLELVSAYAYLSAVAYFESRSLSGFAHWMRLQHEEENGHAMKFFQYIQDRGGRVVLEAIAKPNSDFSSPLDAFEKSLAHERKVTASIHNLYELALANRDYATVSLLKWFVDEQVEEEKNASEMVDRLTLAGDNSNALLLLDRQAGQRGPGV